jgi:glycosyltransferase involved in cell wall biosynthesis
VVVDNIDDMKGVALSPSVSIVIPTRNAAKTLQLQLDALFRQEEAPKFEVIIADNGSTDDLEAVVAASPLRDVRVVRCGEQPGVGYARNAGVGAARAQLILICDADDEVSNGWVAAMARGLDQYDLVGGPILFEKLNTRQVQRWHDVDSTGFGSLKTRPYALGGNTGFHRRVFEDIGGYDLAFAGGGDDNDFSWRAQSAGFTIGFVPEGFIECRLRDSLGGLFRQARGRGRMRVVLEDRYVGSGTPRPLSNFLRQVFWVTRNLPLAVVYVDSRGRWVRALGLLVGGSEARWGAWYRSRVQKTPAAD